MDPRLYMIAGTFALLVVAVIATIVSAVRAFRRRRFPPPGPVAPQGVWPGSPAPGQAEFDTSLDGLEVEVHADSPSAALLVPLRTGVWVPPEHPAPAEKLAEASLEARIASHAVVVPAEETHADLAVEEEPPTQAVLEPPAEMVASVPPALFAEVPELPYAHESHYATVTPVEPAVAPPNAAPLAAQPVPGVVEPVPGVVEPEPEPGPGPEPEPTLAFQTPAPLEPEPRPVWRPSQGSEMPSQPEALPIDAIIVDTFWQPPSSAQQDLPTATTVPLEDVLDPAVTAEQPVEAPVWEIPVVLAPAIERPAAVVHEPLFEPEWSPSELAAVHPTRSLRPRAVVRAATPELGEDASVPHLSPLAPQTASSRSGVRDSVPGFIMAAPVEMWFGDQRIGVKPGSKTYEQFRRYADVLFDDLRTARRT